MSKDDDRERAQVDDQPPVRDSTHEQEHTKGADSEKVDRTRHPAFYPLPPEDRLKPGETIMTFIPRRRKPKKP